ncbi:ketopantoate reductase family protein [Frondihabitans cladoniiphilus]|uniref:2-dehydropantoate 2-reductase n=1 Tax=Frondihabitans cladoniiphilus TaxID=715785 RepID=A0ABP8WE27_9MICO
MRILVVGAGAVGGYFGGLLAAAGRDVTFLVRERRAAQLASDGLVVETLDDRIHLDSPATVTAETLAHHAADPFDVVVLSVKAFGLEQAVADIAPAIGPDTMLLPLLNGLQHYDRLTEAFGESPLIGGLCRVATQIGDDGTVRQLLPGASMAYGELDGSVSPRIHRLDDAMRGAGFDTALSDHIRLDLWEKWFLLASGGALTTLVGGDVGEIEAVPNGADTARAILAEFVAVAAAAGFEPTRDARAAAERTLTQPGSGFMTSTYRDWRAGNEVEADQLLGDLVRRAKSLGVPTPLLAAADAHLELYRARR